MNWILNPLVILVLLLAIIPESLSFFIEGTYNLSSADLSKEKLKVGLFTPYELTPGGGERYFLSVATTFFDMGYSIELLLKEENVCGTRECLGYYLDIYSNSLLFLLVFYSANS